jgi:hypothetical protein
VSHADDPPPRPGQPPRAGPAGPTVNLVDETWIDANPARVAAAVGQPAVWALWWPGLELTLTLDRGLEGLQWSAAGRWVGSVELWLEPMQDGVLVHHYLRLRGSEKRWLGRLSWLRPLRPSRRRDPQQVFARQGKRVFWQLKDELESSR